MKKGTACDTVSFVGTLILVLLGVWNVVEYAFLGELASLSVACSVSLLFCLASLFVWKCRLPLGWIPLAILSGVLFFCSNIFEVLSNLPYLFCFLVCVVIAILSLIAWLKERTKPALSPVPLGCLSLSAVLFAGFWTGNLLVANARGTVQTEYWAVPDRFDRADCAQQGKIERITYPTKAYATDFRQVQKSAYVYLPYGYDESKEYNILYLLHGTGDREDYWLVKHASNKTMLDNLIAQKVIEPLIVVTPTWYVEDDCADELDKLTYSFRQELRSDLLPFVESRYATYAKGTEEQDFENSRDHRAFAGLSRGSVTVFHSAINGSLDYFSYFGCFSGCRTSEEEFANGISSAENSAYPIRYFYNTSGSFDFMLKEHLKSYRALVEREDRLREGINCSFDAFPMRYHSIGSWHLALYNALLKFFV